MCQRSRSKSFSIALGLSSGILLSTWTSAALAQVPPAEGEEAQEGAAPEPAAPPSGPTAEPPSQGPEPAPAAAAPPPQGPPGPPGPPPPSLIPDGEAPKGPVAPAFPPAIPNVDFGGRVRAALRFQNLEDPEKLDDVGEILEADLYMSGQVHRFIKWQSSVTLSYSGNPGQAQSATANALDLIARFEPLPEFNVYLGRMIVVVDRFAPSGPWGMDEFFFPGFFPFIAPPALPKAGQTGRDVGVTVWGAPFGGYLKYYLGAFNLHDPALNPLVSGRLQANLWSPEPAYYQRTTYMGTKDIASIGIGGQYQKEGSVQPVPPTTPPTVPQTDDYNMVSADLMIDKNIGDAGTLSLVGAYSKFSGDFQRWEDFMLASIGYMMPKPIGIGKVRATVRYQRAMDQAPGSDPATLLDAQLSYNVAAWFSRFQVGFRRSESYIAGAMGAPGRMQPGNAVYVGMTVADP